MALIKCPECGKEISDKAHACPNCGCPASNYKSNNSSQYNNAPRELPPEEQPEMFECYRCGRMIPIDTAICPFCGCNYGTYRQKNKDAAYADINRTVGQINWKTNKSDIGLEKSKKGGFRAIIIVIIVIAIVSFIWLSGSKEDRNAEETSNHFGVDNSIENTDKKKQEPTTNIEANAPNLYGDISDFSYEIVDGEIALESYDGKNDILEIKNSYVVSGMEYPTDISNFQIGIGNSQVHTLILDEGFTEVNDAIFNSCDVQNVFFPKSMVNIYDKTLSYLHPETDGKNIQIYYAGTQEEWFSIFTEYKRTKVEDAELGEEMGTALADKLNELMGSEYDSSLFEYYFSAVPDDLK